MQQIGFGFVHGDDVQALAGVFEAIHNVEFEAGGGGIYLGILNRISYDPPRDAQITAAQTRLLGVELVYGEVQLGSTCVDGVENEEYHGRGQGDSQHHQLPHALARLIERRPLLFHPC